MQMTASAASAHRSLAGLTVTTYGERRIEGVS